MPRIIRIDKKAAPVTYGVATVQVELPGGLPLTYHATEEAVATIVYQGVTYHQSGGWHGDMRFFPAMDIETAEPVLLMFVAGDDIDLSIAEWRMHDDDGDS